MDEPNKADPALCDHVWKVADEVDNAPDWWRFTCEKCECFKHHVAIIKLLNNE